MWDEITYPFLNFNGATVEVLEWISNFIPHFTEHVITYKCWFCAWDMDLLSAYANDLTNNVSLVHMCKLNSDCSKWKEAITGYNIMWSENLKKNEIIYSVEKFHFDITLWTSSEIIYQFAWMLTIAKSQYYHNTVHYRYLWMIFLQEFR